MFHPPLHIVAFTFLFCSGLFASGFHVSSIQLPELLKKQMLQILYPQQL
jgi:hypothetical protein